MIPVPHPVMNDYVAILTGREIPSASIEHYKKWLRYFYDYSANHLDTEEKPQKVKLFIEKLRSRKQTPMQCQQAAHAISLYFEMQSLEVRNVKSVDEPGKGQNQTLEMLPSPLLPSVQAIQTTPIGVSRQRQSQYTEAGYQEKSDSPEWDLVLEAMATEIKVRHYSRKTLQTYANWSRNFQRFLKNKPPALLTTEDVKEYLGFWPSSAKSRHQLKTRHSTRSCFSSVTD